MIIFGGSNLIPFLVMDQNMSSPKWAKFNFMNMAQIGQIVGQMFPPRQMLEYFRMDGMETPEFDSNYAQYLIGDNQAFTAFMSIILGEYYYHNAFVLYDDSSPLIENLVDSISKVIQCRYGITPKCVHEEIDMYYLGDDEEMPDVGHQVFMQDKERYTILTTDINNLERQTYQMEEINGGYI